MCTSRFFVIYFLQNISGSAGSSAAGASEARLSQNGKGSITVSVPSASKKKHSTAISNGKWNIDNIGFK